MHLSGDPRYGQIDATPSWIHYLIYFGDCGTVGYSSLTRDISGIEEKVISLYARGMSTRDIHDQLQDLYGIELSAEMVSKITDKILPQVKEWQSRPLNPVYPFVFMDCIHYKVREDGRILSRAAYVVLGVTVEGYKDILSITVGANETS